MKIIKARKQHECTWCGKAILPGEKHAYKKGRSPRYDEDVMGIIYQDGIVYYKWRKCIPCVERSV